MPLEKDLVPVAGKGFTDVFSHFFARHEDIEDVDAFVQGCFYGFIRNAVGFFIQVLRPKTDNAY
jgi:hypothetical protein